MTRSVAEWLVRWRWALFVSAWLLVVLSVGGARLLAFSNDYRVFFSKQNPQLLAFQQLQNTYTKSDNVLFVLAPDDGKVFTAETLSAVEWLTTQAWQIPYSIRVDSVANFQHTQAEGDDLVVEALVTDAAAYSPQDLERIRQIALQEPLLVDRLISPDGRVTGVNVVVQLPGSSPASEMPAVVDFSRNLAAQLQQRYPDIHVYLTGIVMLNHAFTENAIKDMATLVPIMFGVIVAVLALLLRSVWGTLATMLVIVLSILTAVGIAGWLGLAITAPMASAPTIIMTLAVADCVHLLVTFQQRLLHSRNRTAAMVEALRINLQPIFLTSLTTAIGFLSMNFSDAPPFRDLGNTVAIGVVPAVAGQRAATVHGRH
jgi:predicted RND superfamily exporter protein